MDRIVLEFAAKELKRWIGNTQPIALVGQTLADLPERGVLLGTWRDMKKLGWDAAEHLPKLSAVESDKDQYVLLEQGGRIILSGNNERSTLYAVYEYIEARKGIYWVYPGTATKSAAADIGALRLYRQARFARRGFVFETIYDADYMIQMIDWMAKNRMSDLFCTFHLWDRLAQALGPEIRKRGLRLTLGGHSMKFFLQASEAEQQMATPADHPYTAKQQLDYGDADWHEPFFARVATYLESVPNLHGISLWPEDIGVQSSAVASEDERSFIDKYLRFTERLAEKISERLPQVRVEHIAYNAGLSWQMLEGKGSALSDTVDTLFAYWGRNYAHALAASPQPQDQRAARSLAEWRRETASRKRELTVFEYYSDHFMLSFLFPILIKRINEDLQACEQLGADGVINLVVPYTVKSQALVYCAPAAYDWKFAHGCNSFFYARLSWGDTLEQAVQQYLAVYLPQERAIVQAQLEQLEQYAGALTAWNAPLFPARAVDPEKAGPTADTTAILECLQQLAGIPVPDPGTACSSVMEEWMAYVSWVKKGALNLAEEWEKRI